jgi:hypothetical protein
VEISISKKKRKKEHRLAGVYMTPVKKKEGEEPNLEINLIAMLIKIFYSPRSRPSFKGSNWLTFVFVNFVY